MAHDAAPVSPRVPRGAPLASPAAALSIAPMMGWTDVQVRCVSPKATDSLPGGNPGANLKSITDATRFWWHLYGC